MCTSITINALRATYTNYVPYPKASSTLAALTSTDLHSSANCDVTYVLYDAAANTPLTSSWISVDTFGNVNVDSNTVNSKLVKV